VKATGISLRILYAIVAFPLGAIAGYVLMLQFLLRAGWMFHDPHPSMRGFGYFMMSLASAAVLAITASMTALTMPWVRPRKEAGRTGRAIVAVTLTILAFLVLIGQGHALAFVLALVSWLAAASFLTFVRCGVLDSELDLAGDELDRMT